MLEIMKKILILMLLVATSSTGMKAESVFMTHNNHENSWNNPDHRNHNNNNNHNNRNNQTPISKDKLPSDLIKYLNKNYPGNEIMLSKLKSDGYYYVKIKYNQNASRPYYRNLVFDQKGNPVRG